MSRPGGTLNLAGVEVARLGLGTMRLTGPGTWGDPADPTTAVRLVRHAVNAGINHIDTADAYGPHTVEDLIRWALHPYTDDVLVATKVGMIRPAPNVWKPLGRPDYLRAAVEASHRRLAVDRIGLCYLHRIDPTVPLAEQVGVMVELQVEGKIRGIGLSKVTVDQIDQARAIAPIAAVQNVLNLDELHDPVVQHCADLGIPYVPYRPLNAGRHTGPDGTGKALRHLLDLGPHIAPIPGTSNPDHLDELIAAVTEGA
ncbi:aryl-alcohol dehydrogenase-like predicted oxidoreductase [Kitasatospora gansuensis]|uniref:Aryl-alcohol dehydrogenase-like predicted oxidoreductase n=1 Tax=Kitasatospora gansuensis TaxID=258050 RepID=A0A7W7SIZ3_9ACTN|nr:aldo/keto reductase [Kitasatospora gansuensis]MBB4951227.1 aryl-alcohol dehydrogenase-like predicted oxidoreductase [Kitasatospora gansuensis]